MAETALLLVDVQNEIYTTGGKLHHLVKDTMKNTGMMTNLPYFVKQIRNEGAKIIYASIAVEDECVYGDDDDLFKQGSWNAGFPTDVQPEVNDHILTARCDFSAFQGTELQSIIRREKIKTLYIAGFLTNKCILETAREAHDLGLIDEGLQVFVLKDCCAAESIEKHDYAINFSLQLICKTITSQKVLDSMKQSEFIVETSTKNTSRKMSFFKKSFTYTSKPMRRSLQILDFAKKRNDIFAFNDYVKYIVVSILLQFLLGQSYVFRDNVRPACTDESYYFGGPNFGACILARVLKENYESLRTLVAFILGGFITHSVFLWRTRRMNYCQVCGANRNLILQISSLIPIPKPDDKNYKEIKQERETMERWAILGFELAILKAKGKMDSVSGRAHLEFLRLLVADEWDKLVAGDRHTTVWYWIQQKAVYLTEHGIISSEQRLQTMCTAVTTMRDKANDLMSVIDRDNPHAYIFIVGMLVNLNLICISLYKGVEWAILFYDSQGAIYKTAAMYVDLVLTSAIIVAFSLLYDIAFILYNPFLERPNTDDVPHRIVAAGIRHLAESLGEAEDTRPSTMFWMSCQTEERRRLGLKYRPVQSLKMLSKKSLKMQSKDSLKMQSKDFDEYLKFTEVAGTSRDAIRKYKFNSTLNFGKDS